MFGTLLQRHNTQLLSAPTRNTAVRAVTTANTIGTPAKKLLCAVGDLSGSLDAVSPASTNGAMLLASGYKPFLFEYDSGHAFLILRETSADVVEVQSLISYPDRCGYGTAILRHLCRLADDLGVTLWLDAHPFGTDRQQITVGKLKQVYRRFGFFPIREISKDWVNDYHCWDFQGHVRFRNPMMRNPAPAMMRTAEQAA